MIGKLIVLGPEAALEPRTTGWAQIVLPEPVLAMRGDRFILRDETARWTIGGGEVVNPFASRHRRSEAGLVERLEALRGGDPTAAACAFLDLAPEFASDLGEVATHARLSPAEVVRLHSRAKYLVSCLGFSPGFPYLSGLPRDGN